MAISAIIEFIKKNLLAVVLIGIIAVLLLRPGNYQPLMVSKSVSSIAPVPMMDRAAEGSFNMPFEAAPAPDIKDRMVVQNSFLSLQVANVSDVLKKISSKAQGLGGYMVDSNISKPEESTTGNVTVRVPADKLEDFLSFCRESAVKVVTENLTGFDVTDQYTDTAAQIATLTLTQKKFEEILDKAVNIQDILQAQREIINIQQQIDSLKGQNKYLEQTAKLAKVTVYLASDELELPYAPTTSWRPEVIFKTAVRSLVGFARFLGSAAIWIGVFAVIWVPVLVLIRFLAKRRQSS